MILFLRFLFSFNRLKITKLSFDILYYERDTFCYIAIKDFIIKDS